jgi:hypothetical protein
MIIVKLIGGLGNQMFQYAAAKALALRHGTYVKVDTMDLEKDAEGKFTQRHFELEIFEEAIERATEDEIKPFLKFANLKVMREFQRRLPFLFKHLMAFESGSPYHPEFSSYPANTYLSGFWQSELYFKAYQNEIVKAFRFNRAIIEQNRALAELISKKNSVSLHIRRGDYVSNLNANTFHGLCSMEYYTAAVQRIYEKHQDIELFIFSDDISWCRNNLTFCQPLHFVETNNAASDLYLMSQCRHNIIANSSFSWWGAWLNQNHDKIIIAPKQWIADKSVDTKDIIPESWVKL